MCIGWISGRETSSLVINDLVLEYCFFFVHIWPLFFSQVEVYKSFRPGDVIMARVVSLPLTYQTFEFLRQLICKTFHPWQKHSAHDWRAADVSLDNSWEWAGGCSGYLRSRSVWSSCPLPMELWLSIHTCCICICAGFPMVPISWCEMQCTQTLVKEPRKVAKVQPDFIKSLGPLRWIKFPSPPN